MSTARNIPGLPFSAKKMVLSQSVVILLRLFTFGSILGIIDSNHKIYIATWFCRIGANYIADIITNSHSGYF